LSSTTFSRLLSGRLLLFPSTLSSGILEFPSSEEEKKEEEEFALS
jgi:hypothetical protein